MTPPDEPPSNPYDPTWPKPEQPYGHPDNQAPYGRPENESPHGASPYGQPENQPPYGHPDNQAPYGQPENQPPYGQAPYGQAPYGQAPYGQTPYGAPSYGGAMAPKHPSATTAMVLGISALGGMLLCLVPIVLAPFAWMIGGRAVKEIDANPGRYSGRDQAQAGRIMGIIGTVLLLLVVLAAIAFVALAVGVSESGDLSYDRATDSYTSDPSF